MFHTPRDRWWMIRCNYTNIRPLRHRLSRIIVRIRHAGDLIQPHENYRQIWEPLLHAISSTHRMYPCPVAPLFGTCVKFWILCLSMTESMHVQRSFGLLIKGKRWITRSKRAHINHHHGCNGGKRSISPRSNNER